MFEDDDSVLEKYQLTKSYRDPSQVYAPDKEDGGPRLADKNKDKDKKKSKDKKKPNITIKRTLVRNPDGTVGVEFIDVDTGRKISNPFGDRKKEISAGDFDDVFGKKKKTKTKTSTSPEEDPNFVGYDKNGNPLYVKDGYGVTPTPNASNTSAPANTSATARSSSSPKSTGVDTGNAKGTPQAQSQSQAEPEEQGDKEGSFLSDGYNDPSKDPDYQVDNKFAPAEVPERDFQSEVASSKKENATFASLDGNDFSTIDGNNPHSMEGVNLNDAKSASSNRAWDQATIDKAARTLAGELPGDIDLSTPEGQQEARAVLSTIENRDLANGPQRSVIDAITAPSQYSTWNNDEAAKVANTNYSLRPDEFNKVVNDYLADPNSNLGFTSYHAPYVNPAWSDDMQDVQDIGGHKFGVLPEYSSKMAKYAQPMTDEQKNQTATDIVNQNFEQGFAAPVSDYLAQNTPAIDTTGVQAITNQDTFAAGVNAQRDYLGPDWTNPQQITEDVAPDLNTNGPLSTDTVASINNQVAMDNGFAIQQGNQIAGTPPSIDVPTEVATRSLPSITGVEDGFTTAPSVDPATANDRMGVPQTDTVADRMSGVVPSAMTMDQGFTTPSSPAGVYGDPTMGFSTPQDKAMGFGDYVSTDPSASISPAEAATQTGRINGLYENENVGMLDTASQMASTPPSVAETANAVESMGFTSDATSAVAGSDSPSVDTGVSTSSAGGFTSGTDNADTSTGTDSGGTTGSTGSFGGTDTSTDVSVDAGGESDGFL